MSGEPTSMRTGWDRRLLMPHAFAAVAALASASPAAAQELSVSVPSGPVEPGREVAFMVQVAPGGAIDEVLLDPLPLGGPDTFVHRSRRGDAYGPCPHPTTCYIAFTLDIHAAPGVRSLPLTVTANGRTQTVTGRFVVSDRRKDFDGDGLPDAWEEAEGLLTTTGEGHDGADGDKDGDGVRNVDEYRAGTPPSARHVHYFGDSSPGDRQRMTPCFSFLAPAVAYGRAWARVRLIGDGGRRRQASALAWRGAAACPLPLDRYVADRVIAVEVETLTPMVVEREMALDAAASPFSASFSSAIHGSTPVDASTDWHFAEGPSRRPVDLFLLAFNPASTPVNATYTYYRSAGEPPVVVQRRLAPGRTTVWVTADEPALAGGDFAVWVRAEAPILVDRGLRWNPPGRTAPQESVHAGTAALAGRWIFPRVDASRSSDDRVVLANPGPETSVVEVVVCRRNDGPLTFRTEVGPTTRLVLRAAEFGVDDDLVAIRLTSSNGVPFVADHTQEGPRSSGGGWVFATPGATETATVWAAAQPDSLVLFNPSERDAHVRITADTAEDFGPARTFSIAVHAGRLAVFSPGDQGGPRIVSVVVRSQPSNGVDPAPDIVVARVVRRALPGLGVVRTEAVLATPFP